MPSIYFLGSGIPLPKSGALSGSICRIHIDTQEHKVVDLILHRQVFELLGKVVALQLDNRIIALLKLIYVIKVVQYHFFFPDLPAIF